MDWSAKSPLGLNFSLWGTTMASCQLKMCFWPLFQTHHCAPFFSSNRKLPLKEENGKETLKPDTIEIKVHGDNSLHMTQEDSKA